MDAGPRPAWLTRAERAALAATIAAAFGAWLAFEVLPTYDSLYSLVWGREILAGQAPGFADFGAPTQHPLWVAVGTVLAPFGDAGARAMTLITVASFVVLLVATYRLGKAAFGPLAGALAAGLLVTRGNFGFYAAFAFVDIAFAALIVSAAALEAARPRRAGVVWVLLVSAGLLRPEGWVLAAAYGLWLWRDADLRARAQIVALVALAPLLWAFSDLVATGDPLFSWTYTTGEAGRLGRQRTWDEVPHALWSALAELLKAPVVILGGLGVALALAGRRRRRAAIALALLVLGATTFAIVLLGGVSGQVPRYAVIAAVALALFAGHLVAQLLVLPARRVPRLVPRLASYAALALILGATALAATRLHPPRAADVLSFRHDVEDDLAGALRSAPVIAARRCGPIAIPTHKLTPAVRWILAAPRLAVVARNDPEAERAGSPGAVLLERGKRLIHDPAYGAFGQQGPSNSPRSAQAPPAGFSHRGQSRVLRDLHPLLRRAGALRAIYPLAMNRFELSERWAPWGDLDLIFSAARAAIAAGPLEPLQCEVVFNEEFDPFAVDSLEQAQDDLRQNPHMMSMDIVLSLLDEDQARVTLRYSGRRLQLSGYGYDWDRAKAAYDAAQAVLSSHHGVAPKLPKPPHDTVAETRRRLVIDELESALRNVDSGLDDSSAR